MIYFLKRLSRDFIISLDKNQNIDSEVEIPSEEKSILCLIINLEITKDLNKESSNEIFIYYIDIFNNSKKYRRKIWKIRENYESLLTKFFNNTIDEHSINFGCVIWKNKLL